MKSKMLKILGVVAIIATLASTLVAAPAMADVGNVSVSVPTSSGSTDNNISHVNARYTVIATTNAVLTGSGGFSLPLVGDQVTVTGAAGQNVTLSSVIGAPTVATGVNCTWTPATGVIAFTGAGTATITANVASSSGKYTVVGAPTVAASAGSASVAPAGDSVTITFPVGYAITAGNLRTLGAVMSASNGYTITPPGPVPTSLVNYSVTGNAIANTVTFTLGINDIIGSTAQLFMYIPQGITNPGTAGTYSISVKTSQEPNPVSFNMSIVNPTIAPMPGVVSAYNASNVLLAQGNSIANALAACSASSATTPYSITLTAGTYQDSLTAWYPYVTIQAASGVAATSVVLMPAVGGIAVNADHVTISNVTVDSDVGAFSIAAGGTNFTLNNVTFAAQSSTATPASTALLTINTSGATAAYTNTISGCTFNVTGTITATGINDLDNNINLTKTTISNTTFNNDANTADISSVSILNLSKVTFAGTTGTALNVGAGSLTADSGKFSSLDYVAQISGGKVTLTNNTIDTCGSATYLYPAIKVSGTPTGLFVSNNKFTNCPYYAATVTNGTNIFFAFNDLSGCANGFNNAGTTALDAINNFWGKLDPSSSTINTATYVVYTPVLTAAVGAGASGATSPGSTTNYISAAGVTANVLDKNNADNANTQMVAVGAYTANPVPSIAAPSGVSLKLFFDIAIVDATTTDNVAVTLAGTTANPISADSVIYLYSSATGTWVAQNSTPNPFANNITVTLPVTSFAGTPIAIGLKPSVPAAIVTADATPAQGAINVDPNNVNFTWDAVIATNAAGTNAATGYKFYLANADEQIGSDHFGVLTFRANTDINAVTTAVALKYGATYYWKVIPFDAAGDGPATTFLFSTMEKPVTTTAAPPVTITQTSVNIPQVTSTQITVSVPAAQQVQPIPSYLIWAVIAVGAILVIVVIVLIVRTRRIG